MPFLNRMKKKTNYTSRLCDIKFLRIDLRLCLLFVYFLFVYELQLMYVVSICVFKVQKVSNVSGLVHLFEISDHKIQEYQRNR